MRATSSRLFLLFCAAIWTAQGQQSVEQNYTICSWARLRAGIVRDAIYLDGGLLWWQTAFVDGSTPVVSSDGSASGALYRLDLGRPFDTTSTNLSALLEPLPKAGGAGNNIAPNYIDGTMFTNDGELYLYGGLPHLTNSSSSQSDDAVLGYEAFQYGADRGSWSPGFYQGSLEDVSRYVTNGAGVSAPSENLGFYFSGMRAPDHGEIHYEDSSATQLSTDMIMVDMSTMREEGWSNLTLPSEVRPRANAELVWLPVSGKGVLVVIGGVTEPEEIYPTGLDDAQRTSSETISPSFMTSLPIYDIVSETWYVQNISGTEAPPQLTQFCSVYAADEGSGNFDIYIYGGYNGLDASDSPSDEVWVLSIPDFTWTKVYEGSDSHGRSGHHCVSPYPDKMFVIGGVHQNQAQCVEGGFIQVFNLNSLEFDTVYRPDEWSSYKASDKISERNLAKRQIRWADPELEKLFSVKYPQDKIQHFYPYQLKEDRTASSSGGSSTNTIAIAVGVSIGVLIVGLTIFIIWLLRRRRRLRSSSSESSRTRRSRISAWVIGTKDSQNSKLRDSDSMSSYNPDLQQQYSNASALVSSEASEHSISPARHTSKTTGPPQEMAAVDRPAPPFEMATPYNDVSHPRTSTAVDYAYNSKEGHSSESPPLSRSTSSDRSELPTTTEPSMAHHASIAQPRHSADLSHSTSSSSSSSGSKSAWPLPATRPSWSRSPSFTSNGDATTHLLAPPPTTVPAFPRQYRSKSYDSTPDRLRPVLPDEQPLDGTDSEPSTESRNVSSVGSSVSPVDKTRRHGPATELQRDSLMDAISPVSPDDSVYYRR